MKKNFLLQFSRVIDTPQVVIFRSKLEENILRIGRIAKENNLRLRPHIKTHKTPQLAHLQRDLCYDVFGGITTSKVDEGLVFAENGFHDILIAYPVTSTFKAQKFLHKMKHLEGNASVLVDSFHSYRVWEEVSTQMKYPVNIMIKIDVGLHRCGFDPTNGTETLIELLDEIVNESSYCNFFGLISHAGQAYGKDTAEEVKEVAYEEQVIMKNMKELIEQIYPFFNEENKIEISVGSTPTCLACEDYLPDLVTEIRPGNYVFCDRTPLRLGLVEEDDISMNILAEVVSENEWYYILDCGSKTLSSDRGAQGSSGSVGYGKIYGTDNMVVEKLSEEHGWVAKLTEDQNSFEIGDKVLVIPNHACAVSNLGDDLLVYDENDDVNPFVLWSVDARGRRK